MVLEVAFERNAARYDGGKLDIVHRTAAGVGGEILFRHFFKAHPMPAAKPIRVAASMIVLTSLLSVMVYRWHKKFKIN